MKKIYSLIAVAFTAATMNAQLTLTQAAYEQVVGDIETTQGWDTVSTLPRNTGQNQLWNFSSIVQSTNAAGTTSYVSPSTVPSSSLFPGATLVSQAGSPGLIEYYFYKSTSGANAKIEELGYNDIGAYANYTNSAISAAWPISYGTTQTDTYDGPLSGTAIGIRSGSTSISATGSGTIIMPGGQQFTNVLQIKTIAYDAQNVSSPPSTLTITAVTYSYYRAGEKSAILSLFNGYIMNSSGTYTIGGVSTATTTSSGPVGILKQSESLFFSVFPNPAKTHVTVALSNAANAACDLQICNALGALVKKADLGKDAVIDADINISDLAPGIYFMKTQQGDKTAVKKFIVE